MPTGIRAFVVLVSWSRRPGTMLGKGGEPALWPVPQVLALAAFVCRAYTSGAMDYVSSVCLGPAALMMLIGWEGSEL